LEQGRGAVLANAIKLADAFQLTVYELFDIPGPVIVPWLSRAVEKTNQLRSLRVERGWTLDELAKRALVPRSTIAQIERGLGPSLNNGVRIAAALGVTVYDVWSIPKYKAP
jgi:DNA-binding XRE family transcriptional regulator